MRGSPGETEADDDRARDNAEGDEAVGARMVSVGDERRARKTATRT